MPAIAMRTSLSAYRQLRPKQVADLYPQNGAVYSMVMNYTQRGKRYEYDIILTPTKCNYGGYRYWFICPKCSRRVGVLYHAGVLVCRHCINAPYKTQLMQPLDRLHKRVAAIRDRLGWQAGIANGHGSRPKGMHRTTYNRLVKEHDELAAMIYASYGKWLAQRTKQLQKSL